MSPDAYLEMAETESRHWWFAGRRALLATVIAKLDLPRPARILEIGSGTGGNLHMLSQFGRVQAVEMDATARTIALQRTGGRFDVRLGRCPDDIPFRGEKFDLICLLDVLEHIDADVETLLAARRLLSDGGRILVTVPAHRWLWSAHDEFLHHKRRYSLAEFRAKMSAARLRTQKLSYFNTFLFPLVVAARTKDRLLRSGSASGRAIPGALLNDLLRYIFSAERFLLERCNLSFGVSLMAVLRSQ
jgi:SAM-dependent methyltransferase